MKKSVVILLRILNIFLFNSCKDKNKSTFSPQLEYISISCNHSNYNYCYSFTAYTKDSKAYFSADCTIENFELSGKHIEFENKKIAYNEFLKIQNFAKKNNLYNLYSNHKNKMADDILEEWFESEKNKEKRGRSLWRKKKERQKGSRRKRSN